MEVLRSLATLTVGVLAEARWIAELAHYDFRKVAGYLVAFVPGTHGCPHPHFHLLTNFQTGISNSSNWKFSSAQYLGIVPTSVLGLSHRFCFIADSKGIILQQVSSEDGYDQLSAMGAVSYSSFGNSNSNKVLNVG